MKFLFQSFFTPSKSNKGGAGIYFKNTSNAIVRADLKILDNDFESTWIEIINEKSKNIVCGCIYRHPCSNLEQFNEYIMRETSYLKGKKDNLCMKM